MLPWTLWVLQYVDRVYMYACKDEYSAWLEYWLTSTSEARGYTPGTKHNDPSLSNGQFCAQAITRQVCHPLNRCSTPRHTTCYTSVKKTVNLSLSTYQQNTFSAQRNLSDDSTLIFDYLMVLVYEESSCITSARNDQWLFLHSMGWRLHQLHSSFSWGHQKR